LNPEKAEEKGLMVGSWQNPWECPLTLPDGTYVMLDNEGNYKYLERKANNG
jgi:hypothetical protein